MLISVGVLMLIYLLRNTLSVCEQPRVRNVAILIHRCDRIRKSEEGDAEGIRPHGGAVLAVGLQRAR